MQLGHKANIRQALAAGTTAAGVLSHCRLIMTLCGTRASALASVE
jgi:hypothetical protein